VFELVVAAILLLFHGTVVVRVPGAQRYRSSRPEEPMSFDISSNAAKKRQGTTSVVPQTEASIARPLIGQEASVHDFSRATNRKHQCHDVEPEPRSVRARLQSCHKPEASMPRRWTRAKKRQGTTSVMPQTGSINATTLNQSQEASGHDFSRATNRSINSTTVNRSQEASGHDFSRATNNPW